MKLISDIIVYILLLFGVSLKSSGICINGLCNLREILDNDNG